MKHVDVTANKDALKLLSSLRGHLVVDRSLNAPQEH